MAVGPIVSITTPSEGQYFKTPSPSFSFSATGDAPVHVYCNVDGLSGGPTEAFHMPTCPTGGEPIEPVADGGHFLHVMAEDSGGATTVVSRIFRVDTVLPTVTISSPANGSTIVDETPTIAFSIVGAASGECSFDGGAFVACDMAFQSPELAQGTHKLKVRATDLAGNVGSSEVTFIIDLSAPLSDPVPPDSANVTAGKSKVRGRSLKILVKSQILPSPDVSPKVSCTGKVKISIKPKVRKARTYKRRVNLRRSGNQCVANGTVTVPRKYKGKRATLRMYFGGNDYMGKISVIKTIRL